MWWLLVFFLSFSLLVYAAFPPTYLALLAYFPKPDLLINAGTSYLPDVFLSLFLILLVLLYFRLLFGLYLRNFERQADLYSLESLGTAEGLIRSLKKVAALSGQSERLPSWHHGSIAERITFLRQAMLNPSLVKKHHRRVRWLLAVYLLIVCGLTLLAWQIPKDRLRRQASLTLWKGELLREARNFSDPEIFTLLAEIATEEGREAEAIRYYEKALSLDPQNAKLLNNLAWLLVTAKDLSLRAPERALVLARQAVAREPLAIYLDTLAEAWFAVGNPDRACLYETLAWSRAQDAPDFYPQGAFYQKQRERFCRALRQRRGR
jgi:tetratricopeptide (TPR) repeat protein